MGRTTIRQPDPSQSLSNILQTQENFLLPLELLNDQFRTGRIEESGLSRAGFLQRSVLGESLGLTEEFAPRIIDLQARLQQEAIRRDPIARASQEFALESIEDRRRLSSSLVDAAETGLEDLDRDGLPDDLNRSILESTRKSLAARGLTESGVGGTIEALNLIGGREGLRERRLARASAVLSGTGSASSPGLALAQPVAPGLISPTQFAPNANTLTGFAGPAFGALSGLAGQQANLRFQENLALGEGIGQVISLAGSFAGGLGGGFGGGGFGGAGVPFLGGGFGGGF